MAVPRSVSAGRGTGLICALEWAAKSLVHIPPTPRPQRRTPGESALRYRPDLRLYRSGGAAVLVPGRFDRRTPRDSGRDGPPRRVVPLGGHLARIARPAQRIHQPLSTRVRPGAQEPPADEHEDHARDDGGHDEHEDPHDERPEVLPRAGGTGLREARGRQRQEGR